MAKSIRKEPEYWDANEQYIFEDMQVMTDHDLNALCSKFSKSLSSFCLNDSVYFESGKVLRLKEILPDMIEKV